MMNTTAFWESRDRGALTLQGDGRETSWKGGSHVNFGVSLVVPTVMTKAGIGVCLRKLKSQG